MKKLFFTGTFHSKGSGCNQIFRIMRLTTCFLFLFTWFAFAESVNSQNVRVNINKNQVQLKEVLDEIESQTDYLFISNRNINLKQKVSVQAENKPVREVLNNIFNMTDLSFTVEGVNIVLSQKTKATTASTPQQQTHTISGIVVDSKGEPIIGANVVQKGTTNGTITDMDGKFSLSVPVSSVLHISFIGYIAQELSVGNTNLFNVKLIDDTQNIDEVVVVGYGTQKKANLTGSVSTVSIKEMGKRQVGQTSLALQGLVPGLAITQRSGQPGADGG
ncbi:MAG: carboxypeptidase-like regulatory domain-containing protein, partial [Bacteroidales bacterium]